MRTTRFPPLALALVLAAACSTAEGAPRLENAFSDPEAVARAALDALWVGDWEALESFLVTREEHETLLWDALPESKHLTFGDARALNVRNTRKALNNAFRDYRSDGYELLGIEFTKSTEVYEEFTLHRGARLRLRRQSDGSEGYLIFLDVLLEYHGQWKPMNYKE
jgi:hypothetical protein